MSDASQTYEVVHEKDNNRFAIHVEDETAVLEYKLFKDKVAFNHTGVPTSLEGRGIGSRLAKTALEWAQEERLRVIPVCPFVKSYIERHPEYADLTKR
jgi:predicted GNAT family acetyltransferase